MKAAQGKYAGRRRSPKTLPEDAASVIACREEQLGSNSRNLPLAVAVDHSMPTESTKIATIGFTPTPNRSTWHMKSSHTASRYLGQAGGKDLHSIPGSHSLMKKQCDEKTADRK